MNLVFFIDHPRLKGAVGYLYKFSPMVWDRIIRKHRTASPEKRRTKTTSPIERMAHQLIDIILPDGRAEDIGELLHDISILASWRGHLENNQARIHQH